jgi:hypothetical protein
MRQNQIAAPSHAQAPREQEIPMISQENGHPARKTTKVVHIGRNLDFN